MDGANLYSYISVAINTEYILRENRPVVKVINTRILLPRLQIISTITTVCCFKCSLF